MQLLCGPALVLTAARDLVLSNFPATVAPDVLETPGGAPVRRSAPVLFSLRRKECQVSAGATPGGGLRCWRPGTSSPFCG